MLRIILLAALAALGPPAASALGSALTSYGREFIICFPSNYRNSKNSVNSQLIVSPYRSGHVEVTVSVPLAPHLYKPVRRSLTYGQVESFEMPAVLRMPLGSSKQDFGIHVVATDDVTVYGMNLENFTSDGFLALPVTSIGHNYSVLSLSDTKKDSFSYEFAVVGTADNTRVEVTVPPLGRDLKLFWERKISENSSFSVVLGKYQVLQLASKRDPSGVRVAGSKPVSFLSGSNMVAVYGKWVDKTVPSHDHVIEQFPDLENWGRTFLAVPMKFDHGMVIKVLASMENTTVTVMSPDGHRSIELENNWNSHQFIDKSQQPLLISANNPILVAQGTRSYHKPNANGDPTMTNVIPLGQYTSRVTYRAPPSGHKVNFTNRAILIARSSLLRYVRQDATPVSDVWRTVPTSPYSIADIVLPQKAHTLHTGKSHAPLGVILYGYTAYEAYAMPGGWNQRRNIGFHTMEKQLLSGNQSLMNSSLPTLDQNTTTIIGPLSIDPFTAKVVGIATVLCAMTGVMSMMIIWCVQKMAASSL